MDTSRGSPQDCHKPLKKRKARYILTAMAKVPEEEDEPKRPRILRKSRKTVRNEPEMSKISTDSGENQQTLPIKKRSHKSPVGTPMKDSNETGKAARAARGPKKKIRKMETTPKKRYIPTGRPRGRPRLSDELRLERRKHRKSYYIPNGRPRGRPRGTTIEVKERKKIWDAKRNEKKRIERAIRQKIKEEAKNIAAFSAKSRNSKHSAKASKLSREDLLNWHQPFWSQSLLIHRPFERNENAKMRLVVFNAYFNDDQPNPALTPDEILFAKHMLVIESLPTHLQERSDESTKQDRVPFHEIDPPIFNFTAYRNPLSGEWGLFPDDGTPHPPKLEFPPTASTLEEPSTPVDPNKLDGAIQEEVFELYEHDFEDDPKRSALPLAGLLDEAMSSIQNDVCTSQLASAVKTEPPLDSTEDDYEEISDNAESSNVTSKNQPEIDNEGNSTLSLTVYKEESLIKAQEKAVISAYELHFGKAVCGDDSQRLSDLHGCLQFSRRYWDVICNENPELSHSELGQVFVCSWEELPASAKKDMILDYELEVTAASFEAEMKMKAAIEDGEELLKQF